MAGLLDIAPVRRSVPVAGTTLDVGGLSALGIANILQRIPETRKLISGMDSNLSVERIVEVVPEAVAIIIASACGYEGNEQAEKAANNLPAGDQLVVLEAILDLTIPGGLGPFVAKLRSLMAVVSSNDASGAGGKGVDGN